MVLRQEDLQVTLLGECRRLSPLKGAKHVAFVEVGDRIRYQHKVGPQTVPQESDLTLEEAGPREWLYFDPAETSAAVVTCGGLCPGLNNVIRSVYAELTYNYGVRRVLGIRHGYAGLNPAQGLTPVELTASSVAEIHTLGGTVLGTSRGPQDPRVVVDFLESAKLDILFCLGGDGTQRGAHAIYEEVARRGLAKAIVGIPKTIDNDIPFVQMTFGYLTALEKAEEALRGAHVEACGAPNGIAIVKLMGRDAGFIAAGAALASDEANFVLVPEMPFPLEGEHGLLAALQRRLAARQHALIVVAEGAGQHLFAADPTARDASGNVTYNDIGPYLRDRIQAFFHEIGVPVNIKYIDPSYLIRSVPANTWDRILANQMGRNAVHAAMAGRTDVLIGYWNTELIHVPIGTATATKKRLDRHSDLWTGVLSATGQPRW
ncbi:MAG: ATP-dependent 6-phosphofructokinase [Planctomycetota bacterium]|nr:ATP-dependent 6-phosphofructokinase [Planctomycetota bacterium]